MSIRDKGVTPDISVFEGLNQALSSQSIIDVFVVQGLILPVDAEKIKSRYKNNLAIERFLLSNRLISREAINKAYSIILKLPFIGLGNLSIPIEILGLIPKKLEKKYFVLPFAKKGSILNVAIGKPGELFLGANNDIKSLIGSKNLHLEFFISTPEDVLRALSSSGGEKNNVQLEQGNLPVIFLRNRNVDMKYLQLLPLNFIEKNRLAIFDRVNDKRYRIAEEDPYNKKTKEIVEYLKKNNNLDFEEFATSGEDIKYLISLYKSSVKSVAEESEESVEIKGSAEAGIKGIMDSLASDNKPGLTIEKTEKYSGDKATKVENAKSSMFGGVKTKGEEEAALIKAAEDEDRDIGKLLGHDIKNIDQLKEIVKEKSIPKLVAGIISYALALGSSDIHIEPESKRIRVRFRVDGVLKDILALPTEYEAQVSSRIKILGTMKLDETRIPQDGRFSVGFKDREVDVRVSVLPTVYGEKTVMRILDKSQGILSLEDLGFVGSAFRIVMEQIKQPYGIILATGPTGSGKSTTLYAILNRINKPGVNVVTLEDPVEYEIAGVNQCQIRPKIGFTFAEGLRSILRQDPNIIMVGEVRDSDTAGMATHAALTGHLVLTTLHTNDAASAPPRLINMGIEPFLITSSINLIIAQRLVRRICPKCREKADIPPALKEGIKKELDLIPKNNKEDRDRFRGEIQFFRGRGCSECTEGFKGRLGIYELLVMNDEIESLAVSRRPASEIQTAAIKSGMLTMKQDGILKALDGLTTIDEILMATGEVGVGQVAGKMSDGDKEEKKQSMISVGDSSMDREPRKEEINEKKVPNQIKAPNPDF
jgi:type II secretory ATPase GspE/PulE/Tfp pilus assembly ATPase PilB-like protein